MSVLKAIKLKYTFLIKTTQVEVPDGSKYVQTEDERTRGGVVRSKLHSLETSKNARKSEHERTKVWT